MKSYGFLFVLFVASLTAYLVLLVEDLYERQHRDKSDEDYVAAAMTNIGASPPMSARDWGMYISLALALTLGSLTIFAWVTR